jgi:hypothetical protein
MHGSLESRYALFESANATVANQEFSIDCTVEVLEKLTAAGIRIRFSVGDTFFRTEFRAAAEQADLGRLFQPDDSRFLALCQPCWHNDPEEHRSSMTDLARFVEFRVIGTPIVNVH